MATSPDVIFQIDVWVEAFSLVVALFISAFSLSAYLITKQTRQQRFSLAFLFISIGIFARAVLNTWVQFETLPIPLRGYIQVSYLHSLLLLSSMLFIVAGYLTLVLIVEHVKQRRISFLLYLLAPFTALVAHEYYVVFHLVVLLLLAFLIRHFLDNYRQARTPNALIVLLAFCALFLANAILLFTVASYIFYLVGTVVQLVGFLLFLTALILIFLTKT